MEAKRKYIIIIIVSMAFNVLLAGGLIFKTISEKTIATQAMPIKQSDKTKPESGLQLDKKQSEQVLEKNNEQDSEKIDLVGPQFIMQRDYQAVCSEWVSVREKPSLDSKRIGTLENGTVITRTGIEERFFSIDYNGIKGYVHSGYLQPLDDYDRWIYEMPVVSCDKQEYSYDEMMDDLMTLEEKYQGMIEVSNIGYTVLGKEIPVVLFGDEEASHHILIHAGIHGREYMSSLLVMKQLEYYLMYLYADFNDKVSYAELFDDIAFHIIPMANPDGVSISQFGTEQIQDQTIKDQIIYISGNDPNPDHTDDKDKGYFARWRANANGVDLNRNFDAMWESVEDVGGPSFGGYKGDMANSEPETKAIVEYTLKYDFDVTVSYHTFGSQIFWYYNQEDPLKTQCYDLAKSIEKVNYNDVIKSNSTSAVYAGYKDWAIESLGIPSVTVEVGVKYAPAAIEEFPMIFERNYRVWKALAMYVLDK